MKYEEIEREVQSLLGLAEPLLARADAMHCVWRWVRAWVLATPVQRVRSWPRPRSRPLQMV